MDPVFPRPQSGCRITLLILLGALSLGALFRLTAIDAQLDSVAWSGFSYHYDEHRFIVAARQFESAPELLRGYVTGMAAQLFVTLGTAQVLDVRINPVLLLRLIGVLHALCTIVVTYLIARVWFTERRYAAFAALLMALLPLHLVNSQYGTADVSAVSFFFLSWYAGFRYTRTGSTSSLLAMFFFCGACLATKFLLPLLMVPGLIWLSETRRSRIELLIFGLLTVTGSFWLTSALNYDLWDFRQLIDVLINGNLVQNESRTPLQNVWLYSWRLIPSLGLPVFLLAVVGMFSVVAAFASRLRNSMQPSLPTAEKLAVIRSPEVLLVAPLLAHLALIIVSGASSTRHLLPFAPALCVLAAAGVAALTHRAGDKRLTVSISMVGLVLYLVYNAWGTQALFDRDLRSELVTIAREYNAQGMKVHAGNYYARVKGTAVGDLDPARIDADDVVLTCDVHYERYLRQEDADKMHHPHGGQAHTDFFRSVFSGNSPFKIAAIVDQAPITLEQKLIQQGYLPPLETFTPGRCLALAQKSSISLSRQEQIRNEAWSLVEQKGVRFVRYGGRY